ncbi:MAG: hypothetical protein HUU01_11430 [Saprospiraceae bacterium]|nr:hypothetical protein [Saprospiraceae bacterium]
MNKTIGSVILMVFCLGASIGATAQTKKAKAPEKKEAPCKLAFDELDDFDSLRTIGAEAVSFGLFIPSRFETENGPKIIDEGKLLFMYTENDSINSFFMTLAIPEYDYQSITNDYNVFIKLLDSETEVIPLYNVPDQGTFDKGTNMRIYQHTCVVPIDLFYQLVYNKIDKIRIVYKKQKRTFTLTPEQQEAIQKAVQCVGKAAGLWPVKP